jgi:hypothetical protein
MSIDMVKLSANEAIKANGRLLRGTIAEGLRQQATGAIADDDATGEVPWHLPAG